MKSLEGKTLIIPFTIHSLFLTQIFNVVIVIRCFTKKERPTTTMEKVPFLYLNKSESYNIYRKNNFCEHGSFFPQLFAYPCSMCKLKWICTYYISTKLFLQLVRFILSSSPKYPRPTNLHTTVIIPFIPLNNFSMIDLLLIIQGRRKVWKPGGAMKVLYRFMRILIRLLLVRFCCFRHKKW